MWVDPTFRHDRSQRDSARQILIPTFELISFCVRKVGGLCFLHLTTSPHQWGRLLRWISKHFCSQIIHIFEANRADRFQYFIVALRWCWSEDFQDDRDEDDDDAAVWQISALQPCENDKWCTKVTAWCHARREDPGPGTWNSSAYFGEPFVRRFRRNKYKWWKRCKLLFYCVDPSKRYLCPGFGLEKYFSYFSTFCSIERRFLRLSIEVKFIWVEFYYNF